MANNKKHIPNPSWPFYVEKVHPYAWYEKFLSKDECKEVIRYAKSLKQSQKGKILNKGKKILKQIRDSNVTWLAPDDNITWLYRKITDATLDLNNKYFNFDLHGISESLQFTNYKSPSGHYHKHVDNAYDFIIRKLSLSIQLTDPESYIGGDLNLYLGENKTTMRKQQGDLIAFPSYVLHEVTPVTKGERNSLVAWVTGKQFK